MNPPQLRAHISAKSLPQLPQDFLSQLAHLQLNFFDGQLQLAVACNLFATN
jgi:hypothetical protein